MAVSPTFKDLNNDIKNIKTSKVPKIGRHTLSEFHNSNGNKLSISERIEHLRRSNEPSFQSETDRELADLAEEIEVFSLVYLYRVKTYQILSTHLL
jgi:hypothetical protein